MYCVISCFLPNSNYIYIYVHRSPFLLKIIGKSIKLASKAAKDDDGLDDDLINKDLAEAFEATDRPSPAFVLKCSARVQVTICCRLWRTRHECSTGQCLAGKFAGIAKVSRCDCLLELIGTKNIRMPSTRSPRSPESRPNL